MHQYLLALLLLAATPAAGARAEGPVALDDRWPVASGGPLTLDGGLLLGHPAGLDTGLSTGIGAGATFGSTSGAESGSILGRLVRVGARASWSSATESSVAWTVTQADLKLRAVADIRHVAGRGAFGLRLGLGPTFVHETRLRNQGVRAGLTGSDLRDLGLGDAAHRGRRGRRHPSHHRTLAAGDQRGPELVPLEAGDLETGWTALVGTGWQP